MILWRQHVANQLFRGAQRRRAALQYEIGLPFDRGVQIGGIADEVHETERMSFDAIERCAGQEQAARLSRADRRHDVRRDRRRHDAQAYFRQREFRRRCRNRDVRARHQTHAAAEYLYREAELLDGRRWEEWDALFAEDGMYWVPLRHDQQDPLNHASLFYEDAILRDVRRRRLEESHAWSQQPVTRTARHFTPLLNNSLVRDIDDMKGYVARGDMQIVDARPKVRFEGTEAEPRPGLRAGHIPGSRSVPSATIVNADGTLKSKDELERIFREAGIDPQKPVVTTCGSGVTASMLSLALSVIGQTNAAVYDGSWAEWGQESLDTPVETGPPK